MSRILLAWELGDNYGHISILLPIARHLQQRGHEILFVVKNLVVAEQLMKSDAFRYAQCPRSTTRQTRSQKPVSFADILIGAGFGSSEMLAGLINSWHDLFDTFKPDAVVVQYAPFAQFAARLSNLPCLQINTGFESPPDVAPFPCFRPYLKVTRDQLLAKEAEILQNINKISSGQPFPFQSLQEVLKSDIDLLVTLPEMDHYQRRSGNFIGPISMIDDGVTIQWSEKKSLRIFVYLRPFSGIEAILETLKRSDADVIACIPGIDDRLSASYASESFRISTSRVRLSGILTGMDLAITHAGHGTTAAAFLTGVPMLMIPTTVEQWLLSRNIEYLGIGVGIKRARIADEFPAALGRLLADHSYRGKAESIAKKYAGYDQRRVVERIANTIERLPKWAENQRGNNSGLS